MILIPDLSIDRITFSIVSGLAAAIFAYFINSKSLKYLGQEVVTYWAPVFEESLKTGFAIILGANIIISHGSFGAVEALYDIYKSRGNIAYLAGFTGFVSHLFFGVLTQYMIEYFDSYFFAVLIVIGIHIFWNTIVIYISKGV